MIVAAYSQKLDLYRLQCDNPYLLAKLVKQHNDKKMIFPRGWFNCLLCLIAQHKPSSDTTMDDDLRWKQILKDYNLILYSQLDDFSILKFIFKQTIKECQENIEVFACYENIAFLNKVINDYTKSDTFIVNVYDLLINLINKYKPFSYSKTLQIQEEAWHLIINSRI